MPQPSTAQLANACYTTLLSYNCTYVCTCTHLFTQHPARTRSLLTPEHTCLWQAWKLLSRCWAGCADQRCRTVGTPVRFRPAYFNPYCLGEMGPASLALLLLISDILCTISFRALIVTLFLPHPLWIDRSANSPGPLLRPASSAA